jgi:hypothetical protein
VLVRINREMVKPSRDRHLTVWSRDGAPVHASSRREARMDGLKFADHLIGHLVWPLLAPIALVAFYPVVRER